MWRDTEGRLCSSATSLRPRIHQELKVAYTSRLRPHTLQGAYARLAAGDASTSSQALENRAPPPDLSVSNELNAIASTATSTATAGLTSITEGGGPALGGGEDSGASLSAVRGIQLSEGELLTLANPPPQRVTPPPRQGSSHIESMAGQEGKE
jgi:hypothetical protein